MSAESLYQLALPANFTQAYQGDVWREYSRAARTETRRAAHQLLGGGGLVRAAILERATAKFAKWRAASAHILGVHVRGEWRKMPPPNTASASDCAFAPPTDLEAPTWH